MNVSEPGGAIGKAMRVCRDVLYFQPELTGAELDYEKRARLPADLGIQSDVAAVFSGRAVAP